MCAFLSKKVDDWCKTNVNQIFTLRDLVGGKNSNWQGTPLQRLFDNNIEKGKEEDAAIKKAGQDAGRLLRLVISKDEKRFTIIKGTRVKEYQLS